MSDLIKHFIVILFSLLFILPATAKDNATSDIQTEHLIEATVLYDEIYNIDMADGHYTVSVELLMSWEDDTASFLNQFGDTIIHGKDMDNFLETIWYPEFFVSNAEYPRITHYKTLDVLNGRYELFERFDVQLSIDAEMPKFPFGELDLFMDIAAFSGNVHLMRFNPQDVFLGHHDAQHRVVKGNWIEKSKSMEEEMRTSLNHGGKEKFSYLISHVLVSYNPLTATWKILVPLLSVMILSILFNFVINDKKIQLQATLFLTIPALQFALANEMPSTSYLTIANWLFLFANFIVFINLVICFIESYAKESSSPAILIKIDYYAKIFVPIIFFAFLFFIGAHLLN